MLHADLSGVAEDAMYLAQTVPGHLAELRTIVEKGAKYIPQIKAIVVKAGSKLPQIASIVDKAVVFLPTIQAIVEDPALPTLVTRIQTLRSLETTARSKAAAAKQPQPGPPGPVGVGLHRFVKPLALYIDFRKSPVKFYALLGVGAVGVVGLGFLAGRWTKRCRR